MRMYLRFLIILAVLVLIGLVYIGFLVDDPKMTPREQTVEKIIPYPSSP